MAVGGVSLRLSHVDVARTNGNMGCVEESLGNFQKAVEYHKKSLEIKIKSLGGAHVYVAQTYGNIGGVLES